MIVEVSDDVVIVWCHGTKVRSCKMTLATSPRAELEQEFAIWLENEQTTGLVVHDNHVTSLVNTQTLGSQ